MANAARVANPTSAFSNKVTFPSFGMHSKLSLSNGNGGSGRHSRAEYHLTRVEVRKVLAATRSLRDRTMLTLMAETGLRRSEVVSLEIADIRQQEQLAVIRNGKGGKTRLIPLTDHLVILLGQCIDGRREGYVFVSRSGGRLSSRQLNRIVERAGIDSGVQHPDPNRTKLTCHLFRHTFARLWKDAGGSIETLSSILGHASQATTMDLYGREGLSDVRSNYAKTMKQISILNDTGGNRS